MTDYKMLRDLRDTGMVTQEAFEDQCAQMGVDLEGKLLKMPEQDLDHVLNEIQTSEQRHAAYAEQVAEKPVVIPTPHESSVIESIPSDVISGNVESTAKPAKATKTKKTAANPRPKASSNGAYVTALLDGDPMVTLIAGGTSPINVETLIDGMQKKVGEKARNLFDNIRRGTRLSVFTEMAIESLNKTGLIEGPELVKLYTHVGHAGKCYAIGTARSQAGQMTALFSALGITQMGKRNPHSALLPAIKLRSELPTSTENA